MLFNSIIFLGFIFIVLSAYYAFKYQYRIQNTILLAASYVFYGYWDWRFLFLIALSTVIDFIVGKKIYQATNSAEKKRWVTLSIVANLGILGFFKYFNFFADSFVKVLEGVGFYPDVFTLQIVLPVGISFYTFQTMSYGIDIYRGELKPSTNFWEFALFVSFFPQLVAGPIERAVNLLPQIQRPRILKTDQINAGIFLIVWGYFKKVVVADNCAIVANQVFENYTEYQGLDLLIGVLAFTLQIYGDFSGYSDIARGLAKIMGFELMLNFRLPYFAVSPSDFWRRWHISLSTWLRDYLYIPLGGNRLGNFNTYRNLFLTMLLGGLWHGAAWNFVIWGAFHGLILIVYRLLQERNLPKTNAATATGYSRWNLYPRMLVMFVLTLFGWLIFRADSVHQISYFLDNLFVMNQSVRVIYKPMLIAFPLIIVQIVQHKTKDLLIVTKLPMLFLAGFYTFLIFLMFVYGVREYTEFIYFQF